MDGESGETIKEAFTLSPFLDFPSGGGADDVAFDHRKILMGSPLEIPSYCAVKRVVSLAWNGDTAPRYARVFLLVSFLLEKEKKKKKISLMVSERNASSTKCSCVPRCSAAINHE